MQVEQLHKIFKLCGSPQDEYWKQSKLPLATMFKPQQPYESTLRDRCKEFPKSAVNLIDSFLSIEPYKRGSASAALESEVSLHLPKHCIDVFCSNLLKFLLRSSKCSHEQPCMNFFINLYSPSF